MQTLKDIFSRMRQLAEQGLAFSTITLIDGPAHASPWIGRMLIVFPDGSYEGTLIDSEFTRAVVDYALDGTRSSATAFALDYQGNSHRCFWDPVEPKPKAVVFGGGHISQPLVEILALLDFEVTVADDRPDFANKNRFPRASSIICDTFANAFSKVKIDASTAVIVITRGHRYDQECLRSALAFNPKYIGMIGSQRRVLTVLRDLRADGIGQDRLDRVKSPIGLDIGAQTPAEIAVSIAAEIISIFRTAQSPCSLSEKRVKHG